MKYLYADKDYAVDLRHEGFEQIARNKNGDLFAYFGRPYKVYINTPDRCVGKWKSRFYQEEINRDFFSNVSWADDEPTSLYNIIRSVQ